MIGGTAPLIVNLRTKVLEVTDESHTPKVKTSAKETSVLNVQVTVHRDKLRIKQPTRCIKKKHTRYRPCRP